jgi:hypothetical protein
MKDPYLKEGRLADVIAAVQVMASAKRPEGKITNWVESLEGKVNKKTIAHWTSIFQDHREFFLVYTLEGESEIKAALRLRYAFKSYDPETWIEYKPEDLRQLDKQIRDRLTTRPLTGDQIQALLNTVIELNNRALAEQSARRWWIPLITALLGFVGAIAGGLLSGLLKVAK